jgi:hypothetical protein
MADHIGDAGHRDFRTPYGLPIPNLVILDLTVGPTQCIYDLGKGPEKGDYRPCNAQFRNAYRYLEHVVMKGHFAPLSKDYYINQKKRLDDFEAKVFRGSGFIRYQRPSWFPEVFPTNTDPPKVSPASLLQPLVDRRVVDDGNTIVKCPSCGNLYLSSLFIDGTPRNWRRNSYHWLMECPKCGKTKKTPNQNVWRREYIYERVIARQQAEIKNLRKAIQNFKDRLGEK